MNPLTSPLLTDLYQLNMIQAYLDHGETETAVFEFYVRKLPPRRGFVIAASLEPGATCPVEIADALVRLAAEVDNRLAQRERAVS